MLKKKSTKDLVHGGSPAAAASAPGMDPKHEADASAPPTGKKKEKKEKAPKEKRGRVKNGTRTKTILGVVCLAAGLLIAFIVAPLMQSTVASLSPVVVLTQTVDVGTRITAEDLTVVQMGTAGVPAGAITSVDDAVGRYITATGLAGDVLTSARLSTAYPTDDPELLALPAGTVAMAVTLDSLEQSVASKLRAGDIIQLFAVLDSLDDDSANTAVIVPELQAVEVLSVTNQDAADITDLDGSAADDAEIDRQVTAAVLAVRPQQAAVLAGLSANAKLHAALVLRGDPDEKAALLAKQALYFEDEETHVEVTAREDEDADVEDGPTGELKQEGDDDE